MSIEINGVGKKFGDFVALENVSLTIPTGHLTALLGPSGGGKSTLLRIIAGLESADEGTVHIEGVEATHLPPQKRNVGFVFQHYAAFKHMSVAKNVAYGLEIRKRSKAETARRVEELLELLRLVQLEGLAKRYPGQLSGGQRQRVALARALAVQPKVLLLDEPFGALDAKVRRELRRWLRKLHDEMGLTSVFVTHDQEEALELADRVAVMNQGKLEQVGTPEEVYDHPANPFVYHFLGNVNLFRGRLSGGTLRVGDVELAVPEAEELAVQLNANGHGAPAVAMVRPHDVEVSRSGNGDSITARVDHISFAGPFVHVQLTRRDTGETIEAAIPRDQSKEMALKPLDEVYLKARTARLFADDYSI